MRRRNIPNFVFPVRIREVKKSNLVTESFYKKQIYPIVKSCHGMIGQETCPICGGIVNYEYTKLEGFKVYECSTNDCLPWPDGGAKQRREKGLLPLTSTRYQK